MKLLLKMLVVLVCSLVFFTTHVSRIVCLMYNIVYSPLYNVVSCVATKNVDRIRQQLTLFVYFHFLA